MKTRCVILFMFLIYFCACASNYIIKHELSAYDELNQEIGGEQVSIILRSGQEIKGKYQKLTYDMIYWTSLDSDSLQTIPTSKIDKIITKGHGVGAIIGFGLGIPVGYAVGVAYYSVRRADFDFGGLLLATSGPPIGAIIGAIQGYNYNYALERKWTHETEILTDIDGNVYETIKIGNQWWMAENLKVTRYRNGDAIPHVTEDVEWRNLTTGAYCYYNNYADNAATYGHIYNWYAATDTRNLAPSGWHVPTDAEWQTLVDYLGGSVAGGKLKETGTSHWHSPNGFATNESGFSALPGGTRGTNPGYNYSRIGVNAYFWSSTESDGNQARYYGLEYRGPGVGRFDCDKKYGNSVRCVKD